MRVQLNHQKEGSVWGIPEIHLVPVTISPSYFITRGLLTFMVT